MVLGERSRCNSHSNIDYSTNERPYPYGSSALVCCQCCLSTHSPCSTSLHRDTTVDDVGSWLPIQPLPLRRTHQVGAVLVNSSQHNPFLAIHPVYYPWSRLLESTPALVHSWVILLIHGRNAIVGGLWNLRQASSSNCLSYRLSHNSLVFVPVIVCGQR